MTSPFAAAAQSSLLRANKAIEQEQIALIRERCGGPRTSGIGRELRFSKGADSCH
ncbi:MAG TPA: hypothetical protein VML91_21520 [Burkholderiales bacterium]|nr:hypothetical protein [Burkholderiales bacterium]